MLFMLIIITSLDSLFKYLLIKARLLIKTLIKRQLQCKKHYSPPFSLSFCANIYEIWVTWVEKNDRKQHSEGHQLQINYSQTSNSHRLAFFRLWIPNLRMKPECRKIDQYKRGKNGMLRNITHVHSLVPWWLKRTVLVCVPLKTSQIILEKPMACDGLVFCVWTLCSSSLHSSVFFPLQP